MPTQTRTLIIKSRGRKYFDCVISGYKAKLVINDVSKDLQQDRVVRFEVKDLSTRNKYGANLIFEPVSIIEDRDAETLREAAKERKEVEKWLGYAEIDLRLGMHRTNAIKMALTMRSDIADQQERLARVRTLAAENAKAWEAEKARETTRRYEERTKRETERKERILFPLDHLPPLNTLVRFYNEFLVFEGRGQTFRINESHPSYCGSHLLGHEGDLGCYCYYRKATEEEVASIQKKAA